MLTDVYQRPLRDLRISVTDKCNFRCTYCMPAEIFGEKYAFLSKSQILSFEEITRLTRVITGLGAVKVRLTGGEPLVRQQIERLVAMLADLSGVQDLAMTTNAYTLPQKAVALKAAGLKRVTVSLDTLDAAIFHQMNGGKAELADVLAGLEAAESVGFQPIKINAVIQRGVNDQGIVDLARFCKERGYILRFIEYMDVGNLNGWEMRHVVPAAEIISRINAELPLQALSPNYEGEVATRYRYQDGGGEIGLITSVTQPFCGGCSRLRLSADGKLYTCLFATHGTDLRTPLRDGATDSELEQLISGTWRRRKDRYSEERADHAPTQKKVEMYHIGG